MAGIDDIKKAATAIQQIVAGMGERSRKRTAGQGVVDERALEADIREGLELRLAIKSLTDTLKNAEATLAKIEAQNKKDQAVLEKEGPGGKAIDSKAPFVMEAVAAIQSVGRKIEFADADNNNLLRAWGTDSTFRSLQKSKEILSKLAEVRQELEAAAQMARRREMLFM